jgi:hypothetical protein
MQERFDENTGNTYNKRMVYLLIFFFCDHCSLGQVALKKKDVDTNTFHTTNHICIHPNAFQLL